MDRGLVRAVEVVALLVSPVHRYGGRPQDGVAALPPGAGPEDVGEVRVLAGLGLAGDRYCGRPAHRDASVTLLAEEALLAVADELGVAPFDPLLARRNVVLRGAELGPLLGRELVLDCGAGPVVLRANREARPCSWMDTALAPGAHRALRGRGGLRCEPLTSGVLRRGSALLTSPTPLDPARAGDPVRRAAGPRARRS